MTGLDMIGGFAVSAVFIVLLAVLEQFHRRRHGCPGDRGTVRDPGGNLHPRQLRARAARVDHLLDETDVD
jgi:hypothetical protein